MLKWLLRNWKRGPGKVLECHLLLQYIFLDFFIMFLRFYSSNCCLLQVPPGRHPDTNAPHIGSVNAQGHCSGVHA